MCACVGVSVSCCNLASLLVGGLMHVVVVSQETGMYFKDKKKHWICMAELSIREDCYIQLLCNHSPSSICQD